MQRSALFDQIGTRVLVDGAVDAIGLASTGRRHAEFVLALEARELRTLPDTFEDRAIVKLRLEDEAILKPGCSSLAVCHRNVEMHPLKAKCLLYM